MTVVQIQHLLCYLGYDTGGADGIWGSKTTQAAQDFLGEFEDTPGEAAPSAMLEWALRNAVGSGWTRPRAAALPAFWGEIRHFTRQEFACRCREYRGPYCDGFPVEPDETLVRLADRVRSHFGHPAHRTSGIRCPRHNADEGGVSNSKHLTGKALDFWVEGVSGPELLQYVQAQTEVNYAYLVGGNVVHMDVK